MSAKQWVRIASLAVVAIATIVVQPSAADAGQISTKLYADSDSAPAKVGQVVELRFQLVTSRGAEPVEGKTIIVWVSDPVRRPLLQTGVTDESGWATIPYKVGNPWPCRDGKPKGAKSKSIRVKAEFADDEEYNNSSRSTTVRVKRPKKCP